MTIQWESTRSQLLINPSYSQKEQRSFHAILDCAFAYPGHLWLATSGSTVSKWAGLSKQAILVSAAAVNRHLQSDSSDRWIQTLPDFHVGGLGVLARARLSGAMVIKLGRARQNKWRPERFQAVANEKKGTLAALVPAQLHDLVRLGLKAPSCLRAVLIGGGALSTLLYQQAVELGWPVLPSYGLTECASQVATAELGSWEQGRRPLLKVLSHVAVKQGEEDRLSFKGQSLLTLYATCRQDQWTLEDPKADGWFLSEDRGKIVGDYLSIIGRTDQLIKIGGEQVDLAGLESLLQELGLKFNVSQDITLVPFPDERLGHVIHLALVGAQGETVQALIDCFQQIVLPFERIRQTHSLPSFPKTALAKIKRKDLLDLILATTG